MKKGENEEYARTKGMYDVAYLNVNIVFSLNIGKEEKETTTKKDDENISTKIPKHLPELFEPSGGSERKSRRRTHTHRLLESTKQEVLCLSVCSMMIYKERSIEIIL